MDCREVKTPEDAFEWSALPPHIPRMTFCRCDEIGWPSEVIKHLGIDEVENVHDRDQLLLLATLTRLCTLEDQIERGELRPVQRGVWQDMNDYDEWYARVFKCSVCGKTMLGCDAEYCSRCGSMLKRDCDHCGVREECYLDE